MSGRVLLTSLVALTVVLNVERDLQRTQKIEECIVERLLLLRCDGEYIVL